MKRIKLLCNILLVISFALSSCTDYESMYNDLLASNTELQEKYDQLLSDNESLQDDYNDLEDDYSDLQSDYRILDGKFATLSDDYGILQDDYTALQNKKQKTTYTPKQNTGTQQNNVVVAEVVTTRTGDKYHRPTCRYVKNKTDTTGRTLQDAVSRGYTACKICY